MPEGRFDALLIESTGISEPIPVTATFDFRTRDGFSLSDLARLDTMVTVVDVQAWLRDYPSTASLRALGQVALDMAIARQRRSRPRAPRRPIEAKQYAAHGDRAGLLAHGMLCSMSRKGDCWDCESVGLTLAWD